MLFLTDGAPRAGYANDADVYNPSLNGNGGLLDENNQTTYGYGNIKSMATGTSQKAKIYAVGTGIPTNDTNDRRRVAQASSDNALPADGGNGSYHWFASTTAQMNGHTVKDLNTALNAEFNETDVTAKNAVYVDKIAANYTFDTDTVKDGQTYKNVKWKFLTGSGTSSVRPEVPNNIYAALSGGQADAVYDSTSKTVYWIPNKTGTLANGKFTSAGHSMEFPVHYNNYTKISETTEYPNTSQNLYYDVYNGATKQNSGSAAPARPGLVFKRTGSKMTLTVSLQDKDGRPQPAEENATYQIGLYKNKQGSASPDKTASVTVSQGQSTGTAVMDIEPGTWYGYLMRGQADLNSEQSDAVAGDTAAITTRAESGSTPKSYSYTTAGNTGSSLGPNKNNVLTVTGGQGDMTFVVRPSEATLSITKTVKGSDAEKTRQWHFTVTLSDTSVSGTFGDLTFTNGTANVTLKHGETKTATGLPIDITYTVKETEANQDGYKTESLGDTGTLAADTTSAAEFTNTRNLSLALPPTGGPGTGILLACAIAAFGFVLVRRKRTDV